MPNIHYQIDKNSESSESIYECPECGKREKSKESGCYCNNCETYMWNISRPRE